MALCYNTGAITLVTLLLLGRLLDAACSTLPAPTNNLEVFALPVGQGDCTIIQCPKSSGKIVVVDCGSSSAGDNQLYPIEVQDYLGDQISNVNAIMITHPDRDHFNYIPSINWNADKIQGIIIGGKLKDYNRANNGQFNEIYNFLKAADSVGKLYTLNEGRKCIGNCYLVNSKKQQTVADFCDGSSVNFDILAANVRTSSNQKSIVMKIVVGKWSMLLSGDMEGAAATEIAKEAGNHLQSTVYKMSHHGASSQANKKTWLAAIKPEQAFASSGYNHGNNRHPRCEAVMRLLNVGTLSPAKTHQFYCGNSGKGADPTTFSQYPWSIYETSPSKNTMCILKYNSNNEFKQVCNVNLVDDDDDDDKKALLASQLRLLKMLIN